jgi:hypothetical protein
VTLSCYDKRGFRQIVNVPAFVVCALLAWLIVPIFVAPWKWLVLKDMTHEITTGRVRAIDLE